MTDEIQTRTAPDTELDLIRRLRDWPATAPRKDAFSSTFVGELLSEAADEIAHLRKRLAKPDPAQSHDREKIARIVFDHLPGDISWEDHTASHVVPFEIADAVIAALGTADAVASGFTASWNEELTLVETIDRLVPSPAALDPPTVEALDAIDAQLDEMRSLRGWRLNLIRENMTKLRRALLASGASNPASSTGRTDPLEDLVSRFSNALLKKLKLAQANGRSGWDHDDWEKECQQGLLRHVGKGDPRDVAAYCAFMWHHGWPTSSPSTGGPERLREALEAAGQALMKIRELAHGINGSRTAPIFDIATRASRAALELSSNPVSQTSTTCQKCGSALGGEAAQVGNEVWCHPCADDAPESQTSQTSGGEQ